MGARSSGYFEKSRPEDTKTQNPFKTKINGNDMKLDSINKKKT
jgi:hypothetical protein